MKVLTNYTSNCNHEKAVDEISTIPILYIHCRVLMQRRFLIKEVAVSICIYTKSTARMLTLRVIAADL
ncbi:8594_t:CDS:2 [Entrophospora sp. SA101]|nr:8594_t:CDS:2 [Entrophospora sp. SA101]